MQMISTREVETTVTTLYKQQGSNDNYYCLGKAEKYERRKSEIYLILWLRQDSEKGWDLWSTQKCIDTDVTLKTLIPEICNEMHAWYKYI